MSTTRRLRAGVVGLGKVAQLHHLPNLVAMAEFELAGLCDLSGDLAARLARSYGVPEHMAVTDHRRLLEANGDLDALLITNRHHGPVMRDALAARVPVFVEKPVCWGLAEAGELLLMQEETGTPVVVGYMKRYDPAVERLDSALASGDALVYVRAHNFAGGRHKGERLHAVLKPGDDASSHPLAAENAMVNDIVAGHFPPGDDHRVAACRSLAELAIHDVNLLRGLVGELQVRAATARQTPAGTCYLVTLSRGDVQCSMEILPDFTSYRDWDEHVSFYTATECHEAVFASPFLRNAPTIVRQSGVAGLAVYQKEIMMSRESPYLRELRHFHEVVTGAAKSRTPLDCAAADLRLVYDVTRALSFG